MIVLILRYKEMFYEDFRRCFHDSTLGGALHGKRTRLETSQGTW